MASLVDLTEFNPNEVSKEEDIIINAIPISSFNPNEVIKQGEGQAPRTLKTSVRLREEIGYFTLSPEEAAIVMERDKAFIASPHYETYKNFWVPMAARLEDWRLEIRKRIKCGKIEVFYYHKSLTSLLRSRKEVNHYLRYGFVPTHNKGPTSSAHILCLKSSMAQPQPKRQKIDHVSGTVQTQKEAVEAFLAESYNNMCQT